MVENNVRSDNEPHTAQTKNKALIALRGAKCPNHIYLCLNFSKYYKVEGGAAPHRERPPPHTARNALTEESPAFRFVMTTHALRSRAKMM